MEELKPTSSGPAGAPEPRDYSPAPPPPPEPLGRKIIEWGLIALLVLSPLPAASTGDWAILIIELAAAVLAGAYLLLERRPHLNAKMAARLVWPRRLLFGLFGVLALQIVPLPRGLAGLLSPQSLALRKAYSPGFAQAGFTSLSIAPVHTLRAALELLAYVLIGFLVVKTVTHRRQIQRLLMVLTAMGAFQAFYGLFELYRSNPHVLFYKKIYNLGSATGTFINRNHFSGYLELILPLALGLIISRIDMLSLGGKRWPEKLAQITGKGFAVNVLLLIAVVVMALGIVLSRSRSGVFVLLFSFVLFFELTVFHFSQTRYRQRWIKNFLKVVFGVVTFGALFVGVETTLGRFSEDKLLQDGRPRYWANVLAVFGDFPVAGTGLGTFADVYPAYETVPLEGRLLHAHNDYLENLSDLGLAGFALLFGTVLFLTVDGFLVWSKRRQLQIKSLGMGGFVAVAAILVHSLTDFNLHIPANTLLFAVVLGLAYTTAYYRKA